MLNDYAHAKDVPGELVYAIPDKHSRNYQGYFVYPDDAHDLKRHSFFRGIRWNELPYSRPPFVPKVKSWEDTRYFDEDAPISDMDDGSTAEGGSHEESDEPKDSPPSVPVVPEKKAHKAISIPGIRQAMGFGFQGWKLSRSTNPEKKIKKKEKKRARDKILRDATTSKLALSMRKKTAFLGYSYRRPKDVLSLLDMQSLNQRGRPPVSGVDGPWFRP